ncbi:MAG TPA: AbrB family transcriptional regulator [Alphaproteobacteria bacterium]|nr:AbrB family transcriptional regulator [Alphaproteobacteria bacterium]
MNDDTGAGKSGQSNVEPSGSDESSSEPARPAEREQRPELRTIALALVIGTVGGAAANWVGLPLAWMIGAMVFTTIASIVGAPVAMAPTARSMMVTVLGVMLGSAFAPGMAGRILDWWPTIAILTIYCATITGVLMVYFHKVAGHSWTTSYFAGAPGGLNEMIIVGGEMGGDVRTIALVHGARVLLVVLVVPFGFMLIGDYDQAARPPSGDAFTSLGARDIALLTACGVIGALGGRAIRLPAAFVTGPMILSAVVHLTGLTSSRPPTELIAAAQVVMGTAVGCRFAGVPLRIIGRTLAEAAGSTTIMLGLTLLFALLLQPLAETSFQAIVLSFAPGGLAEMSLIALALGIDAAFVSTHHIIRIIIVVIAAPIIFRLLKRRQATKT